MAIPAIVPILTSALGTAMSKQNAEQGRISPNQYANNAKTVSQLIKG